MVLTKQGVMRWQAFFTPVMESLYGMTSDGGNKGDGNIFTFDPATNVYTDLKDFNGADGAHPYGGLIEANDGKFYGTTSVGGNMNDGVIFSFDPTTSVYTKLSDFDFTDGANPYGRMGGGLVSLDYFTV